jgi:hydrogenase/urease accessory protein HupE
MHPNFSNQRALPIILAVLFHLISPAITSAHELRPTILSILIDDENVAELELKLNLEALVSDIGTKHSDTSQSPQAAEYDRLRDAPSDALGSVAAETANSLETGLRLTLNGNPVPIALEKIEVPPVGDTALSRVSILRFQASLPAERGELVFESDPRLGEIVLRVGRKGEAKPYFAAFIETGGAGLRVALDGNNSDLTASGFVTYIAIGFEHILPKGFDHILFIIGLFLLSPQLRPLLWQVTSFTAAHTMTLALASLGIVQVPASIIEPLIAASIIFIAVENLFTDRLKRWRPFVVFGFGLLHGLGFASVLSEIGLPPGQFVPALIGFNIGVEVGQLAVIAACFLTVGFWFGHRNWYRAMISMPASVVVALVATFWFLERIV